MGKVRKGVFVIGIVSMLMIGSTFAYFQNSSHIENHFYTTEPKVYIEEKFNAQDQWIPGEEKQKEVRFGNAGKMAVVLRVKFVSGLEENLMFSHVSDQITLNFAESFDSEWQKGTDGWYYYKSVLKPGEQTDITLKSVTFSSQLGNDEHEIKKDYSGAVFGVQITGEMLQASLAEEAAKWQGWDMNPMINGTGVTWNKKNN